MSPANKAGGGNMTGEYALKTSTPQHHVLAQKYTVRKKWKLFDYVMSTFHSESINYMLEIDST